MYAMKMWMQRHLLGVTTAAAVITAIALTGLVQIPKLFHDAPNIMAIKARDGVYDLTEITDIETTAAYLVREEVFYPGIYLNPEDSQAFQGEQVTQFSTRRINYWSQKFSLKVPEGYYAVTVHMAGKSALRVYINGEVNGLNGMPGMTKEQTEVGDSRLLCYGTAKNGNMEIILNCAQFHHYDYQNKSAPATLLLYKLTPGVAPNLPERHLGLISFGFLLCAILLQLIIFSYRPVMKESLYFAAACFAIALRFFIENHTWTSFSGIPGNLCFQMEYMSLAMLMIFLPLYLGQHASGKFLQMLQYVTVAISIAYCACTLFFDSLVYTRLLAYYQVLMMLCISLGAIGFVWEMRRPRQEQAAALFGILVLAISAVRDIIRYRFGLDNPLAFFPISEAALLTFILSQMFALFLKNLRLAEEAKETEQRLSRESEILIRLNQLKSEFLGNISHELKTPLTVASGQIQSIRRSLPALSELEAAKKSLLLIDEEISHMALMVSQLLDISRIDEGHMQMDCKKESAVELVQSILEEYASYFTRNENKLQFQRSPKIPYVWCDRNRLSQVLVNLLTNASQHTWKGIISIAAMAEEKNAVIIVRDTGEGIASQHLPYLFERYYTIGPKKNTRTGCETGTGLGLYICKYIIEAHHGTISVQSEWGHGSVFTIILPLMEGESQSGCVNSSQEDIALI